MARSPARRHACTFCSERFATKEGVADHERTVHRKLIDKLTAPAKDAEAKLPGFGLRFNRINFSPQER